MDKNMVNEAIRTVLVAKYKKDAPGAFKLVESFYKVDKWNGAWHVRDPKTHRRIYADHRRIWGFYEPPERDAIDKVDFVGCLSKPFNGEYWRMVEDERYYKSKAILNHNRLHNLHWNIEFYEREENRVIAEIEKLQKKLVEYSEKVGDVRNEYSAFRRKCGLKERRAK